MNQRYAAALVILTCALSGCTGADGQKPAGAAKSSTGKPDAPASKTSAAKPEESVTWTKFEDPSGEQAFTMDVPSQWKMDGGLVRRTPLDYSTFIRALSPDSKILLIIGDPGPAVFLPALTRRPGSRAYVPGQSYAKEYVEQSIPSVCSQLEFVSGADRPDLANGPLAQMAPYARHDAGEVTYSCIHNGKPSRVYMVAVTYFYTVAWGTTLLAGCVAPEDRLMGARQLVKHMLESSRYEPQWVQRQQAVVNRATANLNAITAAQAQASQSNRANAQRQMDAMTGQFNAYSDVLTQSGTFVDPSGHQYANVPNTQNYHWLGTGGQVAQTAGPAPPAGSGWTPLRQVPGN